MDAQSLTLFTKFKHGVAYYFVKMFIRPKLVAKQFLTSIPPLDDPNTHLIYLLPYDSLVDRMIIKKVAKQLNLPEIDLELTMGQKSVRNIIALEKAQGVPFSSQEFDAMTALMGSYVDEAKSRQDKVVKVLPINVMFGKAPKREIKPYKSTRFGAAFKKIHQVIWTGRRCFLLFSNPVNLTELLQNRETVVPKSHDSLLKALNKVAKRNFDKQYRAFIGPAVPKRKDILEAILNKPVIQTLIQEEAKQKGVSEDEVKLDALKMLNEIASDYNYSMLKLTDRVLTWAWNKLYQGLKITNAEPVRQLAKQGHEIIFAPCHRSHMDYLLLSYVLYREALTPPHIAAGVNLNFWPAGPIFRKLGAFFIRRSFRGNKLYAVIFREYLMDLFERGYSVEYFIEGGRSRTGRLLDPKTGMLLMTVQTLLKDQSRPISIVPVYIGYEHVLEVNTYLNELKGADKKKESVWQMLNAFRKLKKLGWGYMNFGAPIHLQTYLNEAVPDWREDNGGETGRPKWLTPTVNQLSSDIMSRINDSSAINAMNLCCLIILSSSERKMSSTLLLQAMDFHLNLMRDLPYSSLVTLPEESDVAILYAHLKTLGKFDIARDEQGDEVVSLLDTELATYYRNNIQHLFVLPSLILKRVQTLPQLTESLLYQDIETLYPLLKGEFFLHFSDDSLRAYFDRCLQTLKTHNLLSIKEGMLKVNAAAAELVLMNHGNSSIVRYAVLFSLLVASPEMARGELEKQTRLITAKIAAAHQLSSLECYDKTLYTQVVNAVKEQGYLDDSADRLTRLEQMKALTLSLCQSEIQESILSQTIGEDESNQEG